MALALSVQLFIQTSAEDGSYSPEIIHVCVENVHSSTLHTRTEHLSTGHYSCADCNRSSTINQENSVALISEWNMCRSKSFFFIIIKAYLLFTSVTEQQSPCLTSGRPLEGTTTPGSMRSLGNTVLCQSKYTVYNICLSRLWSWEKAAYLPLQSASEAQEAMSWMLAGEQGSAKEHILK